MSRVDEEIVREYFEQNGFLVRQLRKYQVHSRKKTSEEEIDLLVYNPAYRPNDRKPGFFLFSSELPYVHRAIVSVKGWHTSRFTPGMLKSSTQVFRFLEQNVLKRATDQFAVPEEIESTDQLLKILVLPSLPTAEPFRSQSVSTLQSRGVDGIISFRSMLLDIVGRVEVNRNYQKADFLEVIRVLKNYDLVRDTQMELFPPEKS